jgi:hypothetical protein
LLRKRETERLLGRPKCRLLLLLLDENGFITGGRWEDNIKINLKKVRWGHGLDPSLSGHEQRFCE